MLELSTEKLCMSSIGRKKESKNIQKHLVRLQATNVSSRLIMPSLFREGLSVILSLAPMLEVLYLGIKQKKSRLLEIFLYKFGMLESSSSSKSISSSESASSRFVFHSFFVTFVAKKFSKSPIFFFSRFER